MTELNNVYVFIRRRKYNNDIKTFVLLKVFKNFNSVETNCENIKKNVPSVPELQDVEETQTKPPQN